MTTDTSRLPDERDVAVVEERLSRLYNELAPAQQAVLETVLVAGLGVVERAGDDTVGFYNLGETEALFQARRAELQEAWRQADRSHWTSPASAGSERRSVLSPVLGWFRRAPAPQPQPQPQPQLRTEPGIGG